MSVYKDGDKYPINYPNDPALDAHDVATKMPTLGITNKRPEGPCKNTVVNLDEVKKAIETFTGKSLE